MDHKALTKTQAAQILGEYARDLVNANVSIQTRIEAAERLRDAVTVAARIEAEGEKESTQLKGESARLVQENAALTITLKKLQGQTEQAKNERAIAERELDSTREALRALQSQIQAATAHIERGRAAKEVLDSLASH